MSTSSRTVVSLVVLVAAAGLLSMTAGSAGAQAAVNVPVGDLWFCDSASQNGVCTTEINAGDTVIWNFSGASLPHTTTACGDSCDSPTDSPLWDSGTVSDGSAFQFTFDEPGTYLYRCNIHPSQMRGEIVVSAAAPGRDDEPFDEPADDDTVGVIEPEIVAPPSAGTGSSSGSFSEGWLLGVLTVGGAALAATGALGLARRRS